MAQIRQQLGPGTADCLQVANDGGPWDIAAMLLESPPLLCYFLIPFLLLRRLPLWPHDAASAVPRPCYQGLGPVLAGGDHK